jgi:hypothetical protein
MTADAANAELLAVLEEARGRFDEQLERRLLDAIADSALLVPVERDPASGEVGVRASVNPDGSRHLLGFTSAEELAGWAQGAVTDHRVMSGRELAALAKPARAAALWIDPASDHGGRLSRDRADLVAATGALELEHDRADGMLELRTGERPIIVRPLGFTPSAESLQVLRAVLGAEAGVTEAWLLAGAGEGAADVVMVVAGDTAPSAAPAEALRAVLPAGWSGDVYPITPGELEDGDYDSVREGLQVFP